MPSFLDSNFFHYIFLPTLSLVSGFVCLYVDPRKNTRTAIIVILVLAASAIATGASGFLDDQKNQSNQAAAETASRKQAQDLADTKASLADTQQTVHLMFALMESTKTGALAAAKPSQIDNNKVQQSLAATVALTQQPQAVTSPSKPEIQYFSKDIDKNVITQALQQAGFRFTQKPAVLKNDPTNSIWVGDHVAVPDLKLVALTLVRAGVQIHAIQRFRDDSKRHDMALIQIGSYPAMQNAPVWTVDKIQAINELPPRDIGPGLPR